MCDIMRTVDMPEAVRLTNGAQINLFALNLEESCTSFHSPFGDDTAQLISGMFKLIVTLECIRT